MRVKNIVIIIIILLASYHSIYSQVQGKRQDRQELFSLNFSTSVGLMRPTSTITNLDYEGVVLPDISLMNEFGFELEYNLNDNFSMYTGYLLQRRSYKEVLKSGSGGKLFAYSYTFPFFVRYNFTGSKLSPYISSGIYYNLEKDNGDYFSFGDLNGLYFRNTKVLRYNHISIGFEIGKRFALWKQNFSASLHYNYSWQESYSNEYVDDQIKDASKQQFGYGSSNGSAIGLRIKYHFGFLDRIRFNRKQQTPLYKNYVNVDLFGASFIYALSYERFLYRKNWMHLSLKTGISYIPEHEEKGVVYVNQKFRNSTKLMGLFVPNSVNLYVGRSKSFVHLGQAYIVTYSPYNFPQFHNNKKYGWSNYYVSIIGYRFEHKKWAINAQMNFQFSSPVPFGGLSVARGF